MMVYLLFCFFFFFFFVEARLLDCVRDLYRFKIPFSFPFIQFILIQINFLTMIIMSIGRGGDASDGIRLDMMHRNVALNHSRYSNGDHSLDHRHNWNDSLDHRSCNGHVLHSHNR